jgi:GT2 family glycosyltransferase
MDVSIIILNYNTCELTLNAIQSVYDSQTTSSYEIIVVDNHSSDASVTEIKRRYPDVRLIENLRNDGFSKGNNIGIKLATGRYILLLNSDTIMGFDSLQTMIAFMDQNVPVGAAGCKIVLPDGSLDKACKRGFPTPSASFYYAFGFSKLFPKVARFNQYQLGYLDPNQDYPVDCLVGAFMMVRKQAIDQVGMLDEDFFMYGEDIDWCYRIKKGGWQIHYYPYTQIVHHKGASSRRKPFKIIFEFHRAMYLFHRKHYQQKYNIAVNGLVYLGIALKFIVSLVLNRFGSVR